MNMCTYILTIGVTEKKKNILYYLDNIKTCIAGVNDSTALDHVITLLMKASTAIGVASPVSDSSVLRESCQNIPDSMTFETKKKYSPAQKMEKQLTFRKSNTPGRKKRANLLK